MASKIMLKKCAIYTSLMTKFENYVGSFLDPKIKKIFIPSFMNSSGYYERFKDLFNNYQASSSQEYDYEDPDSTMMSVNILNELRRDACVKQNPALDEIEDYLADPVAKTTVDVLGWWSGNSKRFPRLSNMRLFRATNNIGCE
ncbi:uncharacterized protein LOC135931098 isoform X1 [Gordionus sp. m RMFG-2023]|uniref:uncharacterized protein LOC135931098 isoform X1 n=1 Tax=Gordionus sp. m RMFG-2023 TaxID=3053472 RepID=UPI0031FD47A2